MCIRDRYIFRVLSVEYTVWLMTVSMEFLVTVTSMIFIGRIKSKIRTIILVIMESAMPRIFSMAAPSGFFNSDNTALNLPYHAKGHACNLFPQIK